MKKCWYFRRECIHAFRPVTFLPGYVEWKNIGHHRRAGGLPPPNCNDSGVFPLNDIRLDETVGNARHCTIQRPAVITGPLRRGQATRPTVPMEHFPFNETWMVTNLSERMNPFPTNTLEHIPFNETWMVTNLSERMNPFPTNTPEHFSSNKPYIF